MSLFLKYQDAHHSISLAQGIEYSIFDFTDASHPVQRTRTVLFVSSLLPEDLKREMSRYLHKLYYDVVLNELLLMTEFIRKYFDIVYRALNPIPGVSPMKIVPSKMHLDMKTGNVWYNDDDTHTVSIARWRFMYFLKEFERKSLQEIKSELNGI